MHHRIWDFAPGKGTCPGHQLPMRARACWNTVWRGDAVFLSADGSSSPATHEAALAGARAAGAARKEGVHQLSFSGRSRRVGLLFNGGRETAFLGDEPPLRGLI